MLPVMMSVKDEACAIKQAVQENAREGHGPTIPA
jgi:hypothetical protein